MPNRLANETSPYLLQHKDNPVDWYPWGTEALERARAENKPILLSIGYSSCHWCHVMAHESFENPQIAAIMNENYVNIKVDREERPDLDSVYMQAIQLMTGQGGWPMTVFLTPEGVPFYGGTYFAPDDRYGPQRSFPQVLKAVATAYTEQRDRVQETTTELSRHLQMGSALRPSRTEPNPGLIDAAARQIVTEMDRQHGGTGGAPKFPQPMIIEFMLRAYKRTGDHALLSLAELTLEKMAYGGIYDQVGGGFHRYSTDDIWLVPHFEKMLYDNAQLARVYLSAYQLTGNPLYRRVAEETLDYAAREMTSPEGGFYSTQDADSEGEEGKFYVWTPRQVIDVLGPEDGRLFNLVYDVTQRGNFEGKSILHLPRTLDTVAANAGVESEKLAQVVADGRKKLYEARSERVWPGRDEKVLAGWNGLMLRAFAEAASVLGRDDYRQVALRNARFIMDNMVQQPTEGPAAGETRLSRVYKDGRAHTEAFAEDYAFLAAGLISLYEATFEPGWVSAAQSLLRTLLDHFGDAEGGGFFTTSDFHESLIARPKDLDDNAIPSANSVAAESLLRLFFLTTEPDFEQWAVQTMRPLLDVMAKAPTAFGQMLSALDFYLGPSSEVAVIGDLNAGDTMAMLAAVWKPYAPNKVVAAGREGDEEAAKIVPLLADRPQVDGRATAYFCRNYICEQPTTDPDELFAMITGSR